MDDGELTSITHTVAASMSVASSEIHVVDGEHLVTLASTAPEPHPCVPRAQSLCATFLDGGFTDLVEIPDAVADPRFQDNPRVHGPGARIRFYAATPLVSACGDTIGAMCVSDDAFRTLGDCDRALLRQLGFAVLHVLEERRRARGRRHPRGQEPRRTS